MIAVKSKDFFERRKLALISGQGLMLKVEKA
jgi:hypothetical protein